MYLNMRPHRVDDSVLGVRFAADYSQSEVVTRLFSWTVTCFYRKDFVRLQKLLSVIPAKISMLYSRRELTVVSALIYSLHACVKRFQLLLQNVRQDENVPYNCERIALINLNGAAPFPVSQNLTIADAILELCSKVIRLARSSDDATFWRRAEVVACYSDLLREACQVYLKFVYCVLITRGVDDVYEQSLQTVTALLQSNRSCVRREMFRLREFLHDWMSVD